MERSSEAGPEAPSERRVLGCQGTIRDGTATPFWNILVVGRCMGTSLETGSFTLALAGDTMLGRGVAERLGQHPAPSLFSEAVIAAAAEADVFIVNLECAISDRGEPWPDPEKPFFFRAPPVAAEVLARLGVDCVTLANNHALDFGPTALLDTIRHLHDSGVACVGAGATEQEARTPVRIEANGTTIGVVGVTDHPHDYAADDHTPGVAYADLRHSTPSWLTDSIRALETGVVVVTPHWGPNMTSGPVPHVRRAAEELRRAGAKLIAGHSAHVFHGVSRGILYDLGDFLDDYWRDPVLRNDLGLLFLVTFADHQPVGLQAIPLALDYCFTRLAQREEAAWIARRFAEACAAFDTNVELIGGRLVVDWRSCAA
ncbi:MAG TPA: CapA family protein [Acidimicrobiales bacterium]|nr:CapA family protein [Acidimicrobiales bacterium]